MALQITVARSEELVAAARAYRAWGYDEGIAPAGQFANQKNNSGWYKTTAAAVFSPA